MQSSLAPEALEAIRREAPQLTLQVVKDVLLGEDVQGEEAQRLKEAIEAQHLELGEGGLRLRQVDLGDCGMGTKGAEAVARLIRANLALTTLSLTGNKAVGIDGWQAVAKALKENTHIHTLSLDYNHLGDEGTEILAQGLKYNMSEGKEQELRELLGQRGGSSV